MGWRTRLVGLGGTTAVLALVAAVGMLGWQVAESVIISPSPPVVVNLRSFEAPPEPVREVPEGPEKAERQEAKPEPKPEDRKSTRLNSSHSCEPRMPSSD